MKFRKAILAMAVLALSVLPAFAQTTSQTFPQKWYYASDYGQWAVQSQTANTYSFYPGTICQVPSPSPATFFAFNINAPILILDATPANSERVTPSAVQQTGSLCSVTVAPANQHYSFRLVSGTAGLQEVLNQIPSSTAYAAVVWLDRNWYTAAASIPGTTPAAIIAAAKGNAAAYLVDNTTSPFTYYRWNGTSYTSQSVGGPAPTVAPGAGAGTGGTATVLAGSTGASGLISVSTGTTPTASAVVYTATFASVANGGFQYAPSCTTTSVGTPTYTGGATTSTAGPPATYVYTASATALAASTTTYVFQYNCR